MLFFLPKTFRFSLKISAISVALASVMIICSVWQWKRYNWKRELVETYKTHSSAKPQALPVHGEQLEDYSHLIYRTVSLEGEYDFSKQIIVTNRKNAFGPGHLLFAPFKIKGSDRYVLVSRGFLPFEDRTPETWRKYDFAKNQTIRGVVQKSVMSRLLGPKNPEVGPVLPFQHTWFFPEVSAISKQLPYPLIQPIFIQRIGPPPIGKYPEESIHIRVPPSTHFGYMIEWALLAALSLIIAFFLQAFPRRKYS